MFQNVSEKSLLKKSLRHREREMIFYCDFLPRTILSLFPDDAVFGWWIGATDLNRCHWKVELNEYILENHKNLNDNLN